MKPSSRSIESVDVAEFKINAYLSMEQAVDDIVSNHLDRGHIAIAVNPEKVVQGVNNESLAQTMKQADVLFADGIGVVKLMSRKLGRKVARIPGCELWEELMKRAASSNIPIYIVGSDPDTNKKTCEQLAVQYSTPIVGASHGYFDDESAVIDNIVESRAKIVTVALGSPKQEIFIRQCRERGCKAFFMGVGGTYDVFTGHVKRAPKAFRLLGLEWFYRLACQPSRVFRQKNLIIFAWLVLTNKI